jgi:hypothetical protein
LEVGAIAAASRRRSDHIGNDKDAPEMVAPLHWLAVRTAVPSLAPREAREVELSKQHTSQPHYPGDAASVEQMLFLADEYKAASKLLLSCSRRGIPQSRAPCRLVALHAIELYLNALLLHSGIAPSAIRGLHHNLALRAEKAIASGLNLRARTAAHLMVLTTGREYLVSRYDAEMTSTTSQINRLTATLEEVEKKVRKIVCG